MSSYWSNLDENVEMKFNSIIACIHLANLIIQLLLHEREREREKERERDAKH